MFGHRSGFKLLWVRFSTDRQTNQMTTVDQCDHHSPVRSHALILWQVSTSAGSVFTALMEKRGARLQGSVFKSINCSPNPTGSTFVIHPLLQARVGDSFCTVGTTCKTNYFSVSPFGSELLFIHISFYFSAVGSDQTLTSSPCLQTRLRLIWKI